jgi:tetratricopeptide (TPR) repeat protein
MRRYAVFAVAMVVACASVFAQEQAASGRAAPMAKTQEELDAYVAATSQAEIAAAEAAVDAFAQQYPESELRAGAYAQLMQKYQQANKVEKTIAMGRKALSVDPEHTVSLAVTAMALADNTIDSTPDRDARLEEAVRNATAAVQTIETNRWVVPEVAPEQADKIRSTLLATAFMAKGLALKSKKDYDAAEAAFKAAIAANQGGTDPAALLHLAITQDYQKKYGEAIVNVNAAIAAADAQKNTQIATLARKQQVRLKALSAQQKTSAKKRN